MAETPYPAALEEIARILESEPEADEALRKVVDTLHDRIPAFGCVQLSFVEGDALEAGPAAGERSAGDTVVDTPVVYEGTHVATLRVAVEPEASLTSFLEQVAAMIALHCLVGWDTGGIPWSDVG